jgi:hypothetical protein
MKRKLIEAQAGLVGPASMPLGLRLFLVVCALLLGLLVCGLRTAWASYSRR